MKDLELLHYPDQILRHELQNGMEVSTVRLAAYVTESRLLAGLSPDKFESCVFRCVGGDESTAGESAIYYCRYTTEEEAREGHLTVCRYYADKTGCLSDTGNWRSCYCPACLEKDEQPYDSPWGDTGNSSTT